LLYIALGDGGGAGDQGGGHADLGNAQDASERLGSVLRVEVDPEDTRTHFGVPVDNPFAQGGGAREIFAYGFRSPSGLSFDSAGTHALYVTDMGEHLWEEVNLVELGGNYGWNVLEGTHCFDREDFTRALRGCPMRAAGGALLRWPVVEFARAGRAGGLGLAVIGGHVYRGQALPELQGRYVFGTLARSPSDPRALLLVASDPNADQDDLWPLQRIAIAGDGQYYVNHFLKGIAQDQQGELYLMVSDELGPTGTSGQVLRLEAPGD
jgi:glucose/arabinose dehydrogenase